MQESETFTTGTTPVEAKPKSKKKPKAKAKPVASTEPKPPRAPRNTVKARLEAMGVTHVEAYRLLCRHDKGFKKALAEAMSADEKVTEMRNRLAGLQMDAAVAEQRVEVAEKMAAAGKATLARLESNAELIAHTLGLIPSPTKTE